MKVFAIHGIRRQERWYESLENTTKWEEFGIEFIPFEYGYFSIWKFISRVSRNNVLSKFLDFYNKNTSVDGPLPSVVCHSFGTYIFFKSIEKYDSIKFDRVILCGSIISPKIDFKSFFDRKQINYLLNEYGSKDKVVALSRAVLKDGGNSGKVGFDNTPIKYSNKIVQSEYSHFGHSDYFNPRHMEVHWVPFLLTGKDRFSYNPDILKQEIIERIYENDYEQAVEIDKIDYKARIDRKGDYYADYKIWGKYVGTSFLKDYTIITTADSLQSAEKLEFCAQNMEKRLEVVVSNDIKQKKALKIYLDETIRDNQTFYLNYHFAWKNTISLDAGDTDHWSINGVKDVLLTLTFTTPLNAPTFYILKDRKIMEEISAKKSINPDRSVSYTLDYLNTYRRDGVVFYFEGSKRTEVKKNQKPTRFSFRRQKYEILPCHEKDIEKVYQIEMDIEYRNAASEATLRDRKEMFNDGFLVAKDGKGKVVGYLESLIWNNREFETFDQIGNFPLHYNVNGDTLYIIFLAVAEPYRGKKIATKLLEEVEAVANRYRIKNIELVAKDNLTDFYSKRGFNRVKELPDFLKGKPYKSVLMRKEL